MRNITTGDNLFDRLKFAIPGGCKLQLPRPIEVGEVIQFSNRAGTQFLQLKALSSVDVFEQTAEVVFGPVPEPEPMPTCEKCGLTSKMVKHPDGWVCHGTHPVDPPLTPITDCFCRKWNFQNRGGEIWVCKDEHEKGQPCEHHELFSGEVIQIIERLRSDVFNLNKRLSTGAMAPSSPWEPIGEAQKDGTEVWAFNGEQARMKWVEGEEYALWIYADPLLSEADPDPVQPTFFVPLLPDPI